MSNRSQPVPNRSRGTVESNRSYRYQPLSIERLGSGTAFSRAELVEAILSRVAAEFADAVAWGDWQEAAECFIAAEFLLDAHEVVHAG